MDLPHTLKKINKEFFCYAVLIFRQNHIDFASANYLRFIVTVNSAAIYTENLSLLLKPKSSFQRPTTECTGLPSTLLQLSTDVHAIVYTDPKVSALIFCTSFSIRVDTFLVQSGV
jgi:hypothetical protein